MRRALALAVLSAIAAIAQAGGFSSADPDARRSASQAALEQAARAADAGDYEGSLVAAEAARNLDPENADARYLIAVSSLRTGLPVGGPEGELRIALHTGRFRRYTSDDAARLLASILLQTRRYQEALRLASRPSLVMDSDAHNLRIRALRFLGDTEGFLDAVDDGLNRFPSDARIARELLEFAARTPRTQAIAARVLRVEGRLGFYRYLDPGILILLAPFRASVETRRDTVLEYLAPGRRSPRAVVLALELGILADEAAVTDFFSFSRLSWEELSAFRAAIGTQAGRDAFSAAFSRFTGELGHDSEGDGHFEVRTSYRDGEVGSWSLDFDQDGSPELALVFRDGLPGSGRMELHGAEAIFEYAEYPYLSRVRYHTETFVREYLFAPDVLPFPAVEIYAGPGRAAGEGFLPRRSGAPFPSETTSAAAAYRVTERPAAAAQAVRETYLARGVPLGTRVLTADGRSGIVSYRAGRPVLELADMDGDGIYESRFLFRPEASIGAPGAAPQPYRFEADFDLDGVFEYTENLAFPHERTWDYDGDGLVDARASALGDGSELREFSRRFDGSLDTAVVVRSGRVLRVMRGGTELPLVPDAGGRVLWVGSKPFDFGTTEPQPGHGRRNDVRF
ncbi:MAG TPA: hypothetical protein VLH39_07760, partial [Magnetospirillaceae bacterium]|nr:hypothetical protein [Magnetospirillaceae bacterium]